MNGYLQRLLDRGAELTAAAPGAVAADVAPAMASGSPAVAFDQRLAEPGWAQLFFGVPGGSPDIDAAAEAAPLERGALPAPPLAMEGPQAGVVSPLSTVRAAGPAEGLPRSLQTERVVRDVPATGHDNVPQAIPVVSPSFDATRADAARVVAIEAPVPATSRSETRALQAAVEARVREAAPRDLAREAPPVTVERRVQAEPRARAFATPPAARTTATPTASPDARHHHVEPVASADALLPVRGPTPQVEPLRPAPAPLAPPPTATPDPHEVRRMVREAMRAEVAARPAATAPQGRALTGTQDRPRDGESRLAPRPATAREASVIGELEPSASVLTIYGLRRR